MFHKQNHPGSELAVKWQNPGNYKLWVTIHPKHLCTKPCSFINDPLCQQLPQLQQAFPLLLCNLGHFPSHSREISVRRKVRAFRGSCDVLGRAADHLCRLQRHHKPRSARPGGLRNLCWYLFFYSKWKAPLLFIPDRILHLLCKASKW